MERLTGGPLSMTLRYLPAEEVVKKGEVNHIWYKAASGSSLWAFFLRRRYPGVEISKKLPPKMQFIQLNLQEKRLLKAPRLYMAASFPRRIRLSRPTETPSVNLTDDDRRVAHVISTKGSAMVQLAGDKTHALALYDLATQQVLAKIEVGEWMDRPRAVMGPDGEATGLIRMDLEANLYLHKAEDLSSVKLDMSNPRVTDYGAIEMPGRIILWMRDDLGRAALHDLSTGKTQGWEGVGEAASAYVFGVPYFFRATQEGELIAHNLITGKERLHQFTWRHVTGQLHILKGHPFLELSNGRCQRVYDLAPEDK